VLIRLRTVPRNRVLIGDSGYLDADVRIVDSAVNLTHSSVHNLGSKG